MPVLLPLPGEGTERVLQHSHLASSWIYLIFIWINIPCILVGASDLYTSNGSHVLRLTLDGSGAGPAEVQVLPLQGVRRPVGIAVDSHLGWLFWSDIAPGYQGIYRAKLDGSQQSRIVQDVTKVNGLAVDWWGHHVYWTDESRQTIELATYDGANRHIVLSSSLKWPRGIAVDPANGWIYWTDQGTKSLEMARLDGSQRQTLVDTGLVWPNQVVLSKTYSRLFWVDAYNETVQSCNLEGGDQRQELDLQQSQFANPIFGLVLVNASIYFSTWYGGAIYSVPIGVVGEKIKVEAQHLTEREMFSLASDDQTLQPPGRSPCHEKSGPEHCSHLCLVSTNGETRCICPSYRALVLGQDERTCTVPEELLLYADKDHSHVGVLTLPSSLDILPTPNTTQPHILAASSQPVAVGYDPIQKVVYWSDVEEEQIYRVGLDGIHKEVFLNASQGIGQVDGLFVDWHHRRLYFTNRGQSQPTPEGTTFSWHRVEFIGLDGMGRHTLVSNVDKPRAVVLDFEHNYMYYTDWGHEPKVVRTDLDGLNPTSVVTFANVSNPNGLAMQGPHLYVADSNYNKRVTSPFLAVYNTETQSWSHLDDAEVHIPYGLTVRGEDQVFFTDWMSTESTTGAVFIHKSGKTSIVAKNLGNPTGLFYSPTSVQQPGLARDPCAVAPCSDLCVNAPEISGRQSRQVRCLCAESTGNTLHPNKHKCRAPEDFLLFTDLNTVRMLALESHDQHAYILHYGPSKSNFVAVTYDPSSRVVYWSDLTSKSILHGSLDGSWSSNFLQTDLAIDGMAFDTRGHHLYFTGYNSMTGVIVMVTVDGMDYVQLISGLDQPRAIALDLQNNHMFWTEYGVLRGQPRVMKADLDGRRAVEIEAEGLKWPNSIALTDSQLYLADGATCRVEAFALNGSYMGEVAQLSDRTSHIFGMAVESDGSVVYLTDWHRNRTVMARLATGQLQTLASHLYRPSGLVLHRHTWPDIAAEKCSKGRNQCSHSCVLVTNGYHCVCPSGMKLSSDHHRCVEDVLVWQPADDVRCHYTCHNYAVCARLIPTMHFKCVCKEGYHGDGTQKCEECLMDHYKHNIGNDTCRACPKGAGSFGKSGATRCYCQELGLEFQQGQCVVVPEAFTRPPVRINNDDLESTNFTEEGWDTTDLYDYQSPQFEGCPGNPLVELTLATGQSEAVLDLQLSAYDYDGKAVPIEGNHPVPPGAEFTWRGRDRDGYQHAIYTATDLLGRQSKCEFSVYVIDSQPPRFLSCPDNLVVNATGRSMRVFWEEPKAIDNVGVAQIVAPSWDSGWEFRLGTWPITYRAYDLQGNSAWCNFTVSVQRMYIKCKIKDHIRQPRNGGVACGPDEKGYICHTFCDSRQHYLNPGRQYQSVRCDSDGTWLEHFPEDYQTRACLRQTPYRTVERQVQLWFEGPCNPESEDLKTDIIDTVIKLMRDSSLCPPPQDYQGPACHPDHFHVICGASMVENRYKRNAENDKESNTVRLDVKLEAGASVLSNMSFVEELLNATTLRIKEHFAQGVSFTVHGATYRSLVDQAEMEPLQEKCPIGTFHTASICLLCPVGSYLPMGESTCHNCPANSYQDEEGQTFCKTCPEGATTGQGAFNASQCYQATQSLPVLPSRDVIILAVAVAAVLIAICLIIILCLRRRSHIQDKQEDFPLSFKQNKNDEPYIMEVKTGVLDGDCETHVYEQHVPDSSKNSSSHSRDSTLDSKSPFSHMSSSGGNSQKETIQEEIPLVHHRSPGKTRAPLPEQEGIGPIYEVTIT